MAPIVNNDNGTLWTGTTDGTVVDKLMGDFLVVVILQLARMSSALFSAQLEMVATGVLGGVIAAPVCATPVLGPHSP